MYARIHVMVLSTKGLFLSKLQPSVIIIKITIIIYLKNNFTKFLTNQLADQVIAQQGVSEQ